MYQPDKPEPFYIHLVEYYKLKDEQIRRIDYRDRMVEVHLAIVGAAMGWALTHEAHHVLLVIPWVCLILGWAYLINDDRVGAIGQYIRHELADQLRQILGEPEARILHWELIHRADQRRFERKLWQLVVDEVEFVLSGLLAIAVFVWYYPRNGLVTWVLIVAEAVMLLLLAIQFFKYSDFKRGD